jgi:hypothetical protein
MEEAQISAHMRENTPARAGMGELNSFLSFDNSLEIDDDDLGRHPTSLPQPGVEARTRERPSHPSLAGEIKPSPTV